MDGGGRLLGSVAAGGATLVADAPSLPFALPSFFSSDRNSHFTSARQVRRARQATSPFKRLLSRSWLGAALCIGVVGATGLYAARLNGEYNDMVALYGPPQDVVAKAFGFPISSIAVSGLSQLTEAEALQAAGISDRNSLLFLSVADIRDRLKAVPLVRDVTVRKLFPDRLILNFTERDAAAVWQQDGQLSVVAADGVVIDGVHDARFNGLPFVVGEGANQHLPEFLDLVASAGDLKDRITAGVYVGERRWTLKMDSGVQLMLPEVDPKSALTRFAALNQTTKLVDKDVISLDLRIPGRITARLSEDAAAARAAMLAKRPKKVMKE